LSDLLSLSRYPYSASAEQSVLGAMLIEPRCIPDVIEILNPADFYISENRSIYENIHLMFNYSRTIDPVTLLERLKADGVYDETSGRNYIMQLMDITPTAVNVREYARIVREQSILRQLADAGSAIYSESIAAKDSPDEILNRAEMRIYSIRNERASAGLIPIREIITENYRQLSEAYKSGGIIPGISSGFSGIDRSLSGLNKSDLILIAARPAMGKTSLALNIAQNAAIKSQKTVAVFSLEMSRDQLVLRMLSSTANINMQKLRVAELNQEEWMTLAETASFLSGLKIQVDDTSSITVGDISAKCRRLGDDLGLVVIDYLQLMKSAKDYSSRVLEVSEITRNLKIMAKELNIPVICLSQLSRGPEQRTDKRPILSDLRDSGAIEQDADIVMFLYRDDYYNPDSEERNIAECIIAKNRHGPTNTVKLNWIGQFTKFTTQEIHRNDAAPF
jgi:replicative DNA helicase